MKYLKSLLAQYLASLEALKMYYVMRASAPSLYRKSTDFLIIICLYIYLFIYLGPYVRLVRMRKIYVKWFKGHVIFRPTSTREDSV